MGSIKFVGRMRKAVPAKLAEKITACGIDGVAAVNGLKGDGGQASFIYRQSAVDFAAFSGPSLFCMGNLESPIW